MRLHDYLPSGNGYKVRLLLAQLGIPFERIEYDIIAGETRTPEFLENVNPNGRVPVLELNDGRLLSESNAALFYLAEETPFLPQDRFGRARALQWMFFETNTSNRQTTNGGLCCGVDGKRGARVGRGPVEESACFDFPEGRPVA